MTVRRFALPVLLAAVACFAAAGVLLVAACGEPLDPQVEGLAAGLYEVTWKPVSGGAACTHVSGLLTVPDELGEVSYDVGACTGRAPVRGADTHGLELDAFDLCRGRYRALAHRLRVELDGTFWAVLVVEGRDGSRCVYAESGR